MHRVLSTYLLKAHALSTAQLSDIAAAGFEGVEIFCSRGHFDYRSPEQVREVAEWFRDHRMKLHSLHSPISRDISPGRESGAPISICDLERVRRLDAVDEVKRALEVAESIPCKFLVQHLGSSREALDPRRTDAAFSSLEHLAVFAKQRGVTIALENTPGEMASPSTLRHFITDTRLHDLRICFDTGHAHLEEGVERSWETVRDLVATTHVHDNHGEKDEHLLPYEGTIDWNAALKNLSAGSGTSGGLACVLELRENATHSNPLADAAAVFEKFEKARAVAV
ncbi:MAG: sugar phosphate isomerase/epimerase [Acidobacteria bacterium]|nr:sugar phosphate isomerase/epimerase [Acidobacteriota bacterium]